MLKFEAAAKVGDIIRAYDFKPMVGREDCFVEGEVLEVTTKPGYKAFLVKATRSVFGGQDEFDDEHSRVGKTVFVPLEVSFMEYDARIINLSR